MLKKICSLAVLLATGCASASTEGFYVGGGVAYGSVELDDVSFQNTTYELDETSTMGGTFSLGFNNSERFAFEIGGILFQDIDYEGDKVAPTFTTQVGYFDIKPMLANKYMNAFVRLGTAYVYSQNQYNGNGDADYDESVSHNFCPFYGAGIGINVKPELEIVLSANRIQDTNTPITFGQLELTYHFITHYTPGGFISD